MPILLILIGIVDWLEKNMLTCPSKKYLGIECFGCGFQRSFIALCRGNFKDSFTLYPATPLVLFVLLFTILHLIFKFKNGAAIIKFSFMIMASVIVISYIIKLANHNFHIH